MTKSSNTRDHIKTPSIDNDNNWFCSFILFPTSNQRTFQATEITTQYNDAECDDNSVHDHNKDNNDDRNYIIQREVQNCTSRVHKEMIQRRSKIVIGIHYWILIMSIAMLKR